MNFIIFIVLYVLQNVECVYFDSYKGVIISEEQIKKYQEQGNLQFCGTDVELPCDPEGWRRLDGSCNNLEYPTYGTVHTPTLRLLPPVYGEGLTNRKSEKGGELPLERYLRTQLLGERIAADSKFTQLMTYFLLFTFVDNASVQDTMNYIRYTTYCCEPRGRTDYMCVPHAIPDDDPVHRFSHVRCMNQTRPITFQMYGCLENGTTTPVRINTETFLFDMSSVYFFQGRPMNRTFSGGELLSEEIDGKNYPIRNNSKDDLCVLNYGKKLDICFKSISNTVLGGKFTAILFFRHHNYIARQLAALNPCWGDEELFQTARDINIAIYMRIYMHELMAQLLGSRNLYNEGILSWTTGYRDLYNKNILPQISEEYMYGLRYFHGVMANKIKLYDSKGYYTKTYPMTNITLGNSFMVEGEHFEQITQSSFRQPCAKFDYSVDPDISEVGLGPLQHATDITMFDLAKGRLIGFPPYIKYREWCSGKKYDTFDDLIDVMDQERIDLLRDLYATVGDIDLMAGMWSERMVPGGNVPYTIYCLFVDQLRRILQTDRFWYERENRPHPYTLEQLAEIRKASMASVMCVAEESTTKIQRQAFLNISPFNPLVSCKDIPMIDYSKWKDNRCYVETIYQSYRFD